MNTGNPVFIGQSYNVDKEEEEVFGTIIYFKYQHRSTLKSYLDIPGTITVVPHKS
jgi:hypothetical protein